MPKVNETWALAKSTVNYFCRLMNGAEIEREIFKAALQEAPGHRGPVGGPRQLVVPGGGHVRGAPVLAGGAGVWLWHVFWRIVWLGTWCAPVFRMGRLWLQSAQAHATQAPSHLCKWSHRCIRRSQDFLLSFVDQVRYTYARTAFPIPILPFARRIGLGRVGDDF
jgi:hypothetical protein